MRFVLALCAFAAMAGAAFATPPPGVYDFQDQPDAPACAHVCADDSLCVAWTFGGPGKCALMAAAPQEAAEAGWVSGLSPNAPGFVRASASTAVAAADAPAPPPAPSPETTAETALLGGPDESSLRSRLQ